MLPMLFGRMEGIFVLPVGFAILSLNTPVCILLSCDPALERAVRFLPGQRRAFGAPYCLFIFLCNLAADCIYLISWRLQVGSVAGIMPAIAVCFALQSAIASVLLEWNYLLRGWRIESDLWHHPRKYIVPVMMMLAAGIVGTVPRLMYVLFILLAAEGSILFWMCRRD